MHDPAKRGDDQAGRAAARSTFLRLGLEPVGQQVAETASATSKSAVSRKFVAMTETALAELLAASLSGLDLVALMIDGVQFAETCVIVALGTTATRTYPHCVPRSNAKSPKISDPSCTMTIR